jgi:organic radical activating enzyme
MSGEYKESAEAMKERLNAVSSSFCLAKWNMVSLHLTNGKTHSCYHPPTHDIPLEGLAENPGLLHNTPQKIQEREKMRKGERPSGCSYCWRIEDAGHTSDRHYRSSEWWNEPDFQKIATNKTLDKTITPAYVEVNFNQACNFKCVYCSPHLSTSWQEEVEKFGPYILKDAAHNDLNALTEYGLMPKKMAIKNNPYVEAFWKWWPELYKTLKIFRMTGGEPLMDNNTFKVLDYVYENPNPELELSITSNLCPPKQELFDKFLTQVKKLETAPHKVKCYVPDPKNGTEWTKWQHYIIGDKNKRLYRSELPSMESQNIPELTETGRSLTDGGFSYEFDCIAPVMKHFSLFVSCDSVGSQAEYIRTGMDFDRLDSNVRTFLRETHCTNITLINTFNILSIPKLQNFLEWVLDLREEFAYDKQPEVVYDVSGKKQIVSPQSQKIWFDIPILHTPSWLSIKLADAGMISMVERSVEFMEKNIQGDDYSTSFRGFKQYEIDKVRRDLDIMRQVMEPSRLNTDMKRFSQYVDELDRRRNTSFANTFPELLTFYNKCKDL